MLVWIKRLLSRYFLLTEFCKRCGIHQPIIWNTSDELWNEVSDNYNVLCPTCFNKLAREKGILLYWKV